jgi:uncharacterized MAPEG superfamily protein
MTDVSMEAYALSIVGVLALCLLSILLAIYSGSSKGRAAALSGPVLPADDGNLLYRIDRVHMNSVEALAPFVVPAMLAMLVGVRPTTLGVLVWVHVAIRLTHLVRQPSKASHRPTEAYSPDDRALHRDRLNFRQGAA